MALGRENVSVARTHGGADVFGLAGFLRDDDLVSHNGLVWKNRFGSASIGTYREQYGLASCLGCILKWQQGPPVAAFGPSMREPGAACLVTTCGRIEIRDRQNREG